MTSEDDEEAQPLLPTPPNPPRDRRRNPPKQNAITIRAFKSTAHLANLLPTGTLLAFQLLSPVLTDRGTCHAAANKAMTSCLLALCGLLSCLVLSFSDSFRDEAGMVRHGLATFRGLWVIDGAPPLMPPPEVVVEYRIRLVDFVHAFTSVLVFAAVALSDRNVVSCFYPVFPSGGTQRILELLPAGIGAICSMLFVAFPTTRHGIGFPHSAR